MAGTCIRDCLENGLLAGIRAWGLDMSEGEVREGIGLFEDDDELVRAGEAVGVSPHILRNILRKLPTQLRECPGYLER